MLLAGSSRLHGLHHADPCLQPGPRAHLSGSRGPGWNPRAAFVQGSALRTPVRDLRSDPRRSFFGEVRTMARYDDEDDRRGSWGSSYSDRPRPSHSGWRDRDWDDEDDSYRAPGGRSLQGYQERDEELGGARRGFYSLERDVDDEGAPMSHPGYPESHGRDWRDYERERPRGSHGQGQGARYDDEDNRRRDRSREGERRPEWSSERPRYEDDDVERAGYGRGWSPMDSDARGQYARGQYGERSWSGRARDWYEDEDRRGWILERPSWRQDPRGDERRRDERDFADRGGYSSYRGRSSASYGRGSDYDRS